MQVKNLSNKKIVFFFFLFFTLSGYAQITRQWGATYNGQGDYNDRYTCSVSDAAGNIYLGGSTINPDKNRDYLIVKLNSSGTQVWNKQFSGSAKGPDEVTAIAVDQTGNIYVTGFYKQSGTSTDFFTIKMNTKGDTIWTQSYNNSAANGYDQANDIFVDGAGNVYVTGQSDSSPTSTSNDDYVTIKYSPSGTKLWSQRYNGTGNSTDKAEKIVADASGNVFVTGRSYNGNDDDYVTIKYNSSGAQQWVIPGDRGGRDRATAMTIDGGGNIYVTGRSSNGKNDDYWTIKYNGTGTVVWQAAYDYVDNDRATAIAIDGSGNMYVTGQSDSDPSGTVTNWDYSTVKYSTVGAQVWQKSYNGSVSQYDIPSSIVVSSGGAVYVTGVSDADASAAIVNNMVTVSYDASSGNQNWVSNYNGAGNMNDDGNVVIATANGCVAAGHSEDVQGMRNAIAISFNTAGNQQWMNSFNGLGDNGENIHSLVVDASNNVYAAGYIVEKNADRNMAMMKFSSSGTFICNKTLNGTLTGSPDDATCILLDNSGNPILGGFIDNSGFSNDIEYFSANAATCDTFWTKTYNNASANGSDKIADMVKDVSGNLYITGRTDMDPSFNSNDDCYTTKIGATGNIIWSHTYNNTGVNEDRGSFVRLGSNGNIYIVGRTFNGNNYDILILCYDNSGAQLWAHTYNGGANDLPSGMAIDGNNNIYICGRREGTSPGINDYITLKYNGSGVQRWVKSYNGTGNGNDEAQALALTSNGEPVVAGKSDFDPSANENLNIVTLQYDTAGNQLWINSFAGSSGADDIPDDIAVNSLNQVYITGHTNKATLLNPNYDVVTNILSSSGGIQLWSDIFNGVSDSSDIPNIIYIKGNDFYVGGSTFQTGQQRNALVIKYNGTILGINELLKIENAFVFPNPASQVMIVRIPLLKSSNIILKLYDETGRELVKQNMTPAMDNTVDVHALAKGIYFYKIQSEGGIVFSGKVALIQ